MRTRMVFSLTAFIALLIIISWPIQLKASLAGDSQDIQKVLNGTKKPPFALQNIKKLQSFYQSRDYQSAWTPVLLSQLVTSINNTTSHGLSPCDYRVTLLQNTQTDYLYRELLATDSYFTLAGHLLGGKVNPVSIEPSWNAPGRENDLPKYLETSLQEGNIQESLEALAPNTQEYKQLKLALAHYRKISSQGGWGQIASGPLLKLGSHGERVIQIRERLKAGGELITDTDQDPAEYTTSLQEGVQRFQKRINLEADGKVGPNTLRNLNKTPEDRINTLRVNMERWRWLPENLGDRHLRVNIAGFFLEAYDHGMPVRRHNVIVGTDYRQTPVFSDAIEYMILNPWWYAPRKLAVKDKLPLFRNDPGYFERSGFQLVDKDSKRVDQRTVEWNRLSENNFPYQLRQMPGPKNALGRVKFIFPNRYNVYLHDTPSTELFAKVQRLFSSGCIRVENPLDLAEWLLSFQRETGWSREKIEEVVESGKETRINLSAPMPVHLLYWTVLCDSVNSEIRFIEDQYQRDPRILEALDTLCPIK
ncbi:L,D-transpeptidase family protein [Desulfocapsa sulfexigens]|nr:L,D-transpeptidase family protein [Desulfocapsa sulfexigens]